jgi:protein-tyrosine phosphatase
MDPRRLPPVPGVNNFRDFGLYPTPEGRVRGGALFRSGHYSDATEETHAALEALGVAVLVDLRRPSERIMQPNRLGALPVETFASDKGDGDLAPHLEFLMNADLTPAGVEDWMRTIYRRLPYEEQHLELYARTFEALAEDRGPVIVHCAAGKDRTGILCGLIHVALGMDEERVLEDYLLTNHVAQIDERLPLMVQMVAENFGRTVAPEALRPMMGVAEDFLAEAWAEMDARDGSVQGYLERLGVDAAMQCALRARLIAG